MAELAVKLGVRGSEEFASLAERFDRGGRGLQPRLVATLQRENGAVTAVRAAIMGIEVSSSRGGGSSSGLRARVAAATQVTTIAGGVRIEVHGDEVDPAYGDSLAFGLDGLGRWRHPVYGRDVWVQQYGQEVFYATLTAYGWGQGLAKVVDETADEIRG